MVRESAFGVTGLVTERALMVGGGLLFFLLSASARAEVAAQSTLAAGDAIAAGTCNFKCRIVVQSWERMATFVVTLTLGNCFAAFSVSHQPRWSATGAVTLRKIKFIRY